MQQKPQNIHMAYNIHDLKLDSRNNEQKTHLHTSSSININKTSSNRDANSNYYHHYCIIMMIIITTTHKTLNTYSVFINRKQQFI